ncbi:ADP-ribosylation factor family-domain-containing protein [Mucidula mucida]|nr:ADP-ribosylation factor family-domain-containing protein [Mucidula mucida]
MLPSFISRYFPSAANEHTVVILGLDYSGKTTLLYNLKLPGSEITTIPTIGFNVETVAFGKKKLTLWDVGTGCGIQYLYGMLRYYTDQAAGVVWLVDSSDTLRFDESVEEFGKIVEPMDVEKPVLILATKQDLPNALLVDTIRAKFAPRLKGRNAFVFGVLLKRQVDVNLEDAFTWLIHAMSPSVDVIPKPPKDPLSDTHTLSSWLARTETDVPAIDFLEQFQNVTLSSWDHYTHIRIAYVILTTFGRQKGKNLIFDGIERFIAQSPLSNGRKFHVTMTYFWIQVVHLGIRNMPDTAAPSDSDFLRFLLLNGHLVEGRLWEGYYSKETMMSPEAKEGVVLPDKRALPNLVGRDVIVAMKN